MLPSRRWRCTPPRIRETVVIPYRLDRFIAQPGVAAGPCGPAWAKSLRRYLLPPHLDDLGWAPVWSLLYLGFLFMNWGEPNP